MRLALREVVNDIAQAVHPAMKGSQIGIIAEK
jgi:hypothetical protein